MVQTEFLTNLPSFPDTEHHRHNWISLLRINKVLLYYCCWWLFETARKWRSWQTDLGWQTITMHYASGFLDVIQQLRNIHLCLYQTITTQSFHTNQASLNKKQHIIITHILTHMRVHTHTHSHHICPVSWHDRGSALLEKNKTAAQWLPEDGGGDGGADMRCNYLSSYLGSPFPNCNANNTKQNKLQTSGKTSANSH